MPLEQADQIQQLNPSWPVGTDPKSQGDDHLRALKLSLQGSFPGMTAPWTTNQEMHASGFDSQNVRMRNVGVPIDATDAARKGETDALSTRVGALERQAASYASFGVVNGAEASITGGSGDFVVKRLGRGQYRLTFLEAAQSINAQAAIATAVGVAPFSGARTIDVYNETRTSILLSCYWAYDPAGSSSAGDPADITFSFHRLAN